MRLSIASLRRSLVTLRGAVRLPGLVCLASALLLAPGAKAQDEAAPADEGGYKTQTPYVFMKNGKPDRAQETEIMSIVRQAHRGQGFKENQRKFDAWYTRILFPRMTVTTPEALDELASNRVTFLRDLENCRDTEVHDHMIDLAFTSLVPIVRENYHPAVRCNALLIIGSLNQQEVVKIGEQKKLPEPHARALPILVEELERPENSDLLRAAALWGIRRHMDWDAYRTAPLPAAARAAAVNALIKLASTKQPPENRTPEGHAWLRRRALEALGYASIAKAEQNVVDAMTAVLVDDTEPVEVRCAAASALGYSNLVAPTKVDVVNTIREVGRLAAMLCHAELERADNQKSQEEERAKILKANPNQPGFSEGMGEAMPGMMPSTDMGYGMIATKPMDPKAYRMDYIRRRLRGRLFAAQVALQGPVDRDATTLGITKLAKAPADAKVAADIIARLEDVIRVVETPDMDLATLQAELKAKLAGLDALTRRAAAARPGAEPAPADDLPGAAPAGKAKAAAPAPGRRPATGKAAPKAAGKSATRPTATKTKR